MACIHGPCFAIIEKCREAHRAVNLYLRAKREILASENPAAESTEETSSLQDPVVYFRIQFRSLGTCKKLGLHVEHRS